MSRVAALFTRRDTVYRELGADCYDAERDARTFDLACPVVAHPPCRAWANLSHFAKPRDDERDLAWWALHVVRHCGGVLEHPVSSRLWSEAGSLTPGLRDRFGGVLITVQQRWFGHRGLKATGLYIVGGVPAFPTEAPAGVSAVVAVEDMCKAEREKTPRQLAAWLVECARQSA